MKTKDELYNLGRKLYALAMDLAEEENHIEIKNTKNAEVFCEKIISLIAEYNLEEEVGKMRFYKVSKLYLNCLPIDKEVIVKLKDKDCYIGYDLVGDIAIYQKENNEFVCFERIRPSTELNNIFTFLEHTQITTL